MPLVALHWTDSADEVKGGVIPFSLGGLVKSCEGTDIKCLQLQTIPPSSFCSPQVSRFTGRVNLLVSVPFASGSEERDARRMALSGRHWYHVGFLRFPLLVSSWTLYFTSSSTGHRPQRDKQPSTIRLTAGQRPLQPGPEQGRLGASQSPDCPAGFW